MTTRQIRRAAERAERKRTRTEINQANAQNSTGPKTEAGKAASSRNAFKHGLYSKQIVTSREDAAALDALKADLRAQHQPINDTEEILVNEIAEQFWRIKRARVMEANFFDAPEPMFTFLAAIQRLMSSAERGMHKSLAALRQLQKDRGFVPQEALEQPQPTESEGEITAGLMARYRHEVLEFAERYSAAKHSLNLKAETRSVEDLSVAVTG